MPNDELSRNHAIASGMETGAETRRGKGKGRSSADGLTYRRFFSLEGVDSRSSREEHITEYWDRRLNQSHRERDGGLLMGEVTWLPGIGITHKHDSQKCRHLGYKRKLSANWISIQRCRWRHALYADEQVCRDAVLPTVRILDHHLWDIVGGGKNEIRRINTVLAIIRHSIEERLKWLLVRELANPCLQSNSPRMVHEMPAL